MGDAVAEAGDVRVKVGVDGTGLVDVLVKPALNSRHGFLLPIVAGDTFFFKRVLVIVAVRGRRSAARIRRRVARRDAGGDQRCVV